MPRLQRSEQQSLLTEQAWRSGLHSYWLSVSFTFIESSGKAYCLLIIVVAATLWEGNGKAEDGEEDGGV